MAKYWNKRTPLYFDVTVNGRPQERINNRWVYGFTDSPIYATAKECLERMLFCYKGAKIEVKPMYQIYLDLSSPIIY